MPSPASRGDACYSTHRTTHPESLQRSGGASPRRRSPMCRIPIFPSSILELLDHPNSEQSYNKNNILDSIQEKDWKLLAALARKREDDDVREKLADEFHRMWQKEKEERKMVEAETQEQYKRYIHHKREREKEYQEHRRLERDIENQLRTGQLVNYIRHKERRSADVLALEGERKATDLLDNALVSEARAHLAADRKLRLDEADKWKRNLELECVQQKVDEARQRKRALMRDTTQRVAISNALNSWESTIMRREIYAMEQAKQAHHAAKIAIEEARSTRLARERAAKLRKAKKMAQLTAQLREAVRMKQL